MEITTKHYYTDGTEIKEHDLVYLKGYDINRNVYFSGVCKVGDFDGDLFSAYFLGQELGGSYDIEMYLGNIEKLIKLDGQAIDIALEKEMTKL